MADNFRAGRYEIRAGQARIEPLQERHNELEHQDERTPAERTELSALRLAIINARLDAHEAGLLSLSDEHYVSLELNDAELVQAAINDADLARSGMTAAFEAIENLSRRIKALEDERSES